MSETTTDCTHGEEQSHLKTIFDTGVGNALEWYVAGGFPFGWIAMRCRTSGNKLPQIAISTSRMRAGEARQAGRPPSS